jgi:hypothetical protein
MNSDQRTYLAIKTVIVFTLLATSGSLFAEDGPGTTSAAPSAPTHHSALTSSERWNNYAKDSFLSPRAFFASVMPAVGDHNANEPSEYGQGFDAFGERLWRRAAQYQLSMAMYHSSAAALRTESGYKRCHCEGGFRRFGYALSRTFLTRTDGGSLVPNAPLIGGYLGGGMIATTWYPDRFRATREGLRSGSFQLGGRTVSNIFVEFGPELKRFFLRR